MLKLLLIGCCVAIVLLISWIHELEKLCAAEKKLKRYYELKAGSYRDTINELYLELKEGVDEDRRGTG